MYWTYSKLSSKREGYAAWAELTPSEEPFLPFCTSDASGQIDVSASEHFSAGTTAKKIISY